MKQIGFKIKIIHSNDSGEFVEFGGIPHRYKYSNTLW
jgi:hypothetical protein